jgi:UDP-N-acetyl-D-galactosamine dehydrogenase
MGFYVGKQTVKKILSEGKNIQDSRVLVMGATFKENVSDIRNTKVINVIRELESFSVNVDVIDPWASSEDFMNEYGIGIKAEADKNAYDAIIVAVNHNEYIDWKAADFEKYFNDDKGVFVDLKGIYRNMKENFNYWSL